MEFDISRVFTAVNAEELKVGDKVIVADTMADLEDFVNTENYRHIDFIAEIGHKRRKERFSISKTTVCGDSQRWSLAYLVERTTEKKWRPYKDCKEMAEDFMERYEKSLGIEGTPYASPMWFPNIWVKEKETGFAEQVTGIYLSSVVIGLRSESLDDLFVDYSYLDGSPCGIEE